MQFKMKKYDKQNFRIELFTQTTVGGEPWIHLLKQ